MYLHLNTIITGYLNEQHKVRHSLKVYRVLEGMKRGKVSHSESRVI